MPLHDHASDARYQPQPYVQLKNPEWSKNATIYEVNIRQYTPEGTFRAFLPHLPRIKDLGVDILWLMPIHPIGKKNRKGTLGSYYAVKDYYGINPEFGDHEDFRELVNAAHAMGMYLIIDWVANHSAPDNELAEKYPLWYSQTPLGEFQPTPWFDWDDVIDFDYSQSGLRRYMTQVMKYWVQEFDIDGFRADVAGFVPLEFWENLREELEEIKPVFMLAEWESRDLHRRAFDMTYAWSLWDRLKAATTEKKGTADLVEYIATDVKTFPKGGYRMTFTDNHDKNSWNGTPFTIFGDGLEAAMVFACTVNGMPLIYSGQEAGMNRSLSFFEKDKIEWQEHHHADLFRKLFALKKRNQALWNGKWGGEMIRITNDHPDQVISFIREKNGQKVVALFNFSDKNIKVGFDTRFYQDEYTDIFSSEKIMFDEITEIDLKGWGYRVLEFRV
jgi:cyclomaltodextrinase / maltogenic alpha-amylase / neopullulanase